MLYGVKPVFSPKQESRSADFQNWGFARFSKASRKKFFLTAHDASSMNRKNAGNKALFESSLSRGAFFMLIFQKFVFFALQTVKNKIHSWFVTHGKQRK
jgi:hypothetical protein